MDLLKRFLLNLLYVFLIRVISIYFINIRRLFGEAKHFRIEVYTLVDMGNFVKK